MNEKEKELFDLLKLFAEENNRIFKDFLSEKGYSDDEIEELDSLC